MNYIMILRKSIVYNRLFIILILHLRAACSINFEDFAVVVGGKYTSTTASVYNKDGWDYDLPSFNHARTYGHACGAFLDNNNHEVYSFALNICCQVFFYQCCNLQVLIVAGGRDDNDFVLSTESFAMGDFLWTKLSAELPYSFNGARAVKFDNNILLFGK